MIIEWQSLYCLSNDIVLYIFVVKFWICRVLRDITFLSEDIVAWDVWRCTEKRRF
jgi:hypothetical protein